MRELANWPDEAERPLTLELLGGLEPEMIALAIVMALWVNSAMRGRTWLRMAFFTPTILPMIGMIEIERGRMNEAIDAFLARTFKAVAASPDWPRTVFVATYDEWGGFFDHVAPPSTERRKPPALPAELHNDPPVEGSPLAA